MFQEMDLEEFRSFVLDSGIDVWTWIDLAISMASTDYEHELKNRRDGIIHKLYSTPTLPQCQNCEKIKQKNDLDCDDHNIEILQEEEDGQMKVVQIKNLLDDQNQVCLAVCSMFLNFSFNAVIKLCFLRCN